MRRDDGVNPTGCEGFVGKRVEKVSDLFLLVAVVVDEFSVVAVCGRIEAPTGFVGKLDPPVFATEKSFFSFWVLIYEWSSTFLSGRQINLICQITLIYTGIFFAPFFEHILSQTMHISILLF